MDSSRRTFLKGAGAAAGAAILAGAGVTALGTSGCSSSNSNANPIKVSDSPDSSYIITDPGAGIPITGTFLDEISHDIPHQNWGPNEWAQDFKYMKALGIDTVIMIRSGYRKQITWPSEYLISKGCYKPSMDTLELLLNLADQNNMTFYFGLYDSGVYWDTGDMSYELESNKYVIEEVWKNYGHHKSFGGWYISTEISRQTKGCIETFHEMGRMCKDVSGGLPTFISPWIDGKKAVDAGKNETKDSVSVADHEREWDEIFSGIHDVVDACAFQDGHIDFDELDTFFEVNKKLADKYGMKCWTNAESFDRDMPIDFLPIKFDKLRLKLEAAKRQNYDKAITFEFSHFMSPQSAYMQAGHLYNRYRDYFEIKDRV